MVVADLLCCVFTAIDLVCRVSGLLDCHRLVRRETSQKMLSVNSLSRRMQSVGKGELCLGQLVVMAN